MNNLIKEITKTLRQNFNLTQNYKNNLLCLNQLLNHYQYTDSVLVLENPVRHQRLTPFCQTISLQK